MAIAILIMLVYATIRHESCPSSMIVLSVHWVVLVASSNMDSRRLHTTSTTDDTLLEHLCFFAVFISLGIVVVGGYACADAPILLEVLLRYPGIASIQSLTHGQTAAHAATTNNTNGNHLSGNPHQGPDGVNNQRDYAGLGSYSACIQAHY
ncbi:hypothetical protein BASA83_010839 [Batrachochytrium salamandrivorans]|nr:hypothetical protein BASA83_010839 [Batrachochytrium salamandrivorans]